LIFLLHSIQLRALKLFPCIRHKKRFFQEILSGDVLKAHSEHQAVSERPLSFFQFHIFLNFEAISKRRKETKKITDIAMQSTNGTATNI